MSVLLKMNEKDEQHRQELSNVTSQLDQVSFELAQLRKCSEEADEKSRSVIARLERELSCMREGQQELSDVSSELAQLRQAQAEYKTRAEAKLTTLKAVISSHLPFIDSSKCGSHFPILITVVVLAKLSSNLPQLNTIEPITIPPCIISLSFSGCFLQMSKTTIFPKAFRCQQPNSSLGQKKQVG